MDTEARAWLDTTVKRILARHALGDAERAGITYELMSHLHAGGEARATAAGRSLVTREDLQEALADAGGEVGLATAFVQPLARPIEAAPLGRRIAALAIDGIVVVVGLVALHAALDVLLRMGAGIVMDTTAEGDVPFLLPWGYHDPTQPAWVRLLFTLGSAGLILAYFALLEGREGRTLGKRAMELRVVRINGEPMTLREGLIRNVARLSPPLFVLDVIIGFIAFPKDRLRVSDKLAETLVVRA